MEIRNTAISVTFAESEKMIFEKQVADTAECIIGADNKRTYGTRKSGRSNEHYLHHFSFF